MIERDKDFYNQKISELYAVIENQEKIIRDLQENYNNELDENLKLSELCLKAKERIDKAIEYIKINTYENIYKTKIVNANDLLEILEGKK